MTPDEANSAARLLYARMRLHPRDEHDDRTNVFEIAMALVNAHTTGKVEGVHAMAESDRKHRELIEQARRQP